MATRRRSWISLLATLPVALAVGTAQGQPAGEPPGEEPSEAAQLFDEGLKRMLAGHHDDACPMLEESFELEPMAGVKFTLADCEAQRGRVATALRHYRAYLELYEAMPPEKQLRQRGRNRHSEDAIAELEPRVPTLVLSLPADAPAGTEVHYQGRSVAPADLGTPRPFDPGAYLFTVRLPTGEGRTHRITLAEGQRAELALELPVRSPVPDPDKGNDDDGQGVDLRTWAYVAGGVGAAGLLIGGITGAVVLGEKSTIEDNCDDTRCNTAGKEAADDAQVLATVSTVGFVVGIAGLAAGTVLWLVSPDEPAAEEQEPGDLAPGQVAWRPFVGGTPDTASGAVAGVELRW